MTWIDSRVTLTTVDDGFPCSWLGRVTKWRCIVLVIMWWTTTIQYLFFNVIGWFFQFHFYHFLWLCSFILSCLNAKRKFRTTQKTTKTWWAGYVSVHDIIVSYALLYNKTLIDWISGIMQFTSKQNIMNTSLS
jgi:hypothetical protein